MSNPDGCCSSATGVRVVDSHESWAGVTGTVVGYTDHIVLVDPDPAKMDKRPPLMVPWWLLEVIR